MRKASGPRLVAYLIRSPLWLFGWAAALGAFAFQAAALKNGQLSIVQALGMPRRWSSIVSVGSPCVASQRQ
ncbi:MAG: hypothetical protein WA484_12905 [Solirubrobacteraceae bacterium]